ncbi:MAG: sigma-54-dependent Fis family transcriptional regulator [Spirochaetes bacterium]|jgi:two-component system response regulator AtoC|nr:sigma-54-dependent Fis family transcriptional regulator [Spirochaetota bacterium]
MNDRGKILLLDIDDSLEEELKNHLQKNFSLRFERSSSGINKYLESFKPDIAILESESCCDKESDILKNLMENHPDIFVIIISSSHEIGSAISAMKMGAFDYLTKPLDTELLDTVLENAYSIRELKNEVGGLKEILWRNKVFSSIVGESTEINEVFKQSEKIMERDVNVLILGESGTGKELLARAIHAGSKRSNGPFVVVNCAAITTELSESLLFGHKRGSFTGAFQDHRGYFEQANGGTIFLDEIGDMDLEIQAKVLRVIEDKTIRKLGEKFDQKVDFRVVSATNRDFSSMIAEKKFRSDLYYRLEEYPIKIPSLKERKSDIPVLAEFFLKEFCGFYEIDQMSLSEEAMNSLINYSWPGNIRELKNIIRRAAVQSMDSTIRDIKFFGQTDSESDTKKEDEHKEETETRKSMPTLEELERKAIEEAYKISRGNADKTAVMLDISRATLYRKLKKYGIIS